MDPERAKVLPVATETVGGVGDVKKIEEETSHVSCHSSPPALNCAKAKYMIQGGRKVSNIGWAHSLPAQIIGWVSAPTPTLFVQPCDKMMKKEKS